MLFGDTPTSALVSWLRGLSEPSTWAFLHMVGGEHLPERGWKGVILECAEKRNALWRRVTRLVYEHHVLLAAVREIALTTSCKKTHLAAVQALYDAGFGNDTATRLRAFPESGVGSP